MSSIEIIGLIAAVLTSMSFLPQAILVLRTRNTQGISPLMYSMFVSGVALWIFYGVLIQSWPLILANIVTFCFSFCVLIVTLMNLRKN